MGGLGGCPPSWDGLGESQPSGAPSRSWGWRDQEVSPRLHVHTHVLTPHRPRAHTPHTLHADAHTCHTHTTHTPHTDTHTTRTQTPHLHTHHTHTLHIQTQMQTHTQTTYPCVTPLAHTTHTDIHTLRVQTQMQTHTHTTCINTPPTLHTQTHTPHTTHTHPVPTQWRAVGRRGGPAGGPLRRTTPPRALAGLGLMALTERCRQGPG